MFDDEKTTVTATLSMTSDDSLKIMPGKTCLSVLLQKGMREDEYINLITQALRQPDIGDASDYRVLRDELVKVLTPILPLR